MRPAGARPPAVLPSGGELGGKLEFIPVSRQLNTQLVHLSRDLRRSSFAICLVYGQLVRPQH